MRTGLRPMLRTLRTRAGMLGLSREARAVVNHRLTYLPPAKLARLERTVRDVLDRGVGGDVLEFGVALGGTGILLGQHVLADNGRAAPSRPRRAFHGFDVFAMIPPPESPKDDQKSRDRYAAIRGGASVGIGGDTYYGYRENLFQDVRDSFARHGCAVDDVTVCLHKGLFEETWPTVTVRSVAFAHVDCDWYDPVTFCLGAIGDLVSPGGAILIDDYHDYGGARTAVDEFMAARKDYVMEPGANPVLRKCSPDGGASRQGGARQGFPGRPGGRRR